MSAEATLLTRAETYTKWNEMDIEPTPVELSERESVGAYLRGLKRTVWTALLTTLLSAALGILAICNLVLFLQNNASFLHPYLAIFLAFGSAALFAVAVISVLTAKKRIELVIGRILRSSYEPYSVS